MRQLGTRLKLGDSPPRKSDFNGAAKSNPTCHYRPGGGALATGIARAQYFSGAFATRNREPRRVIASGEDERHSKRGDPRDINSATTGELLPNRRNVAYAEGYILPLAQSPLIFPRGQLLAIPYVILYESAALYRIAGNRRGDYSRGPLRRPISPPSVAREPIP